MDIEDVVTSLIASLHAVNRQLVERALEMRGRPEWTDVAWELEVTEWHVGGLTGSSPKRLGFWGYVEGELTGLGGVNWSFDAMRDGNGWVLDRELSQNADHGPGYSETLVRLDDVRLPDTSQFALQLPTLVAELLAIPAPTP